MKNEQSITPEEFNPFHPKDLNNITRMGNITASFEQITPGQAKFILDNYNKNNRKPTKAHYYLLAYNMKQDTFLLNGDTIRFCDNGTLMDGQHRLMAVVSTGIPLTVLIVRGLPWKAMDTIDQALKTRSVKDILTLNGLKYGTILAAGADCYFSLLNHRSPAQNGSSNQGLFSIDNQTSNSDKVAFIMENLQLMEELIIFSSTIYRQFRYLTQKTVVGYGVYLNKVKKHDLDIIKEFFSCLSAEAGTVSTNAMALWRKQIQDADPRNGRGTTITSAKRHGLLAKVWNAFIKGADLKRLNWVTSDDYIELI